MSELKWERHPTYIVPNGEWVQQGQKFWRLFVDGKAAVLDDSNGWVTYAVVDNPKNSLEEEKRREEILYMFREK